MKKITFLCVMLMVGLLVACAPEVTKKSGAKSPVSKDGKSAKPGYVEPFPKEVSLMIKAKDKVKYKEEGDYFEVVFFYYRPDGKYGDWSLWAWSTGGDGATNFDAITEKGFSTVKIDGKTMGYMKFNNKGTYENGCIPLVGAELETVQKLGYFNFIVRKKMVGLKILMVI